MLLEFVDPVVLDTLLLESLEELLGLRNILCVCAQQPEKNNAIRLKSNLYFYALSSASARILPSGPGPKIHSSALPVSRLHTMARVLESSTDNQRPTE